jgi:DNA-directed RNA polymerase specialized sigma24 family protein
MILPTSDPAVPDYLSRMTVKALASACQQETHRFLQGEPAEDAYGVELFRRAVCGRDSTAWEAIATQFRGLLLGWIKRHPAAALVRGEEDYLVNRALARFWMAIGPERFHQFTTLAGLLAYLKMCIHGALMDELRGRKDVCDPLPGPADRDDRVPTEVGEVGALAVGRVTEREIWQTIVRELPDQEERLVVYLSFVHDLKPGEIHRRYSDRYPTAADVYRVKRAALDRLRRSPAMRSLLA